MAPDAAPIAALLSHDAAVAPEQRRRAAAAALADGEERSRQALVEALRGRGSADARRAALEAIADADDPPAELLQPLLALVPGVEAGDEQPLAGALSRYDHPRVVSLAQQVARYDGASVGARRVAVALLASHRTQAAAGVLMELIDGDTPEPVRHAAFNALGRLSGRPQLGRDADAWQQWWTRASGLSETRWGEHLLAGFDARVAQQTATVDRLERRLTEAHRAIYRQAGEEQRPALLVAMLQDGELAVRRLAMEVAVQRLVDDRPFDDPLREALRGRLADADATVRQRATLLLRDLADGPAADVVARRMARAEESSLAVQRAELLMVTRLPRVEAVEEVLARLGEPALRSEAAAAIAAAADADRLTYQQGRRALGHVRQALEAGAAVTPPLVRLLAEVGQEEDWRRIEAWLDAEASAVRQAAAMVWAASDRPLGPLVDRLGDRQIEPIVLHAVAGRAREPEALAMLARHYVTGEREGRDEGAWQRAMHTLAGRVAGDTVIEAIQILRQAEVDAGPSDAMAAVLVGVAGAALEREGSLEPPAEIELRLVRAGLRLAGGEVAPAVADYERVAALLEGQLTQADAGMDAERAQRWQRRVERGRLLASLRGEATAALSDDARGVAQRLDEGLAAWRPDQDMSPAQLLLTTAHQEIARMDGADARHAAADALRELLGDALDAELEQGWRELDRTFAQADDGAAEE
ncbi:MAG: hypothetical protein WD009_14560 [Phycisphaeraceae bacterium]